MAKIHLNGKHVVFHCPGCKSSHVVNETWTFNGDLDFPTINPSILVNGKCEFYNPAVPTCHSFVENGSIRFLDDCSHELAGQTVPIPEWGY